MMDSKQVKENMQSRLAVIISDRLDLISHHPWMTIPDQFLQYLIQLFPEKKIKVGKLHCN